LRATWSIHASAGLVVMPASAAQSRTTRSASSLSCLDQRRRIGRDRRLDPAALSDPRGA
jgi:hypothetical protein